MTAARSLERDADSRPCRNRLGQAQVLAARATLEQSGGLHLLACDYPSLVGLARPGRIEAVHGEHGLPRRRDAEPPVRALRRGGLAVGQDRDQRGLRLALGFLSVE